MPAQGYPGAAEQGYGADQHVSDEAVDPALLGMGGAATTVDGTAPTPMVRVGRPRRPSDSGGIRNLIGLVLGGCLGLFLGYYLVCLIFPENNVFELSLPGVRKPGAATKSRKATRPRKLENEAGSAFPDFQKDEKSSGMLEQGTIRHRADPLRLYSDDFVRLIASYEIPQSSIPG